MPTCTAAPDRRRFLVAAAAAGAAPFAIAQPAYPDKPIRLLLPVSAGSGIDATARKLAPLMAARLGQPLVVENMPGAGGLIGTSALVRSAPDGYTVGMVASTHCITPHLHKTPYDALQDVQPISVITSGPMVLVVPASVPAGNLREFLAVMKSRPEGPVRLGNAGNGTAVQLAAAQFGIQAKLEVLHIPYRGNNNYLTDLVGGQLDGGFLAPVVAMPLVRQGRLKAIGLSTDRRLPVFPEVPTLAESGLPGFHVDGWFAMVAPARVPRPIVDRLQAELVRALKDPEVEKFVTASGGAIVASSVKDAEKTFEKEYADAGAVIRQLGIKAD